MKKYNNLAVFIGRFQPFHAAHKAIIDYGISQAERVLVLIGSAFGPRTLRNPFTYNERYSLIRQYYSKDNVLISPLRDYIYNDSKWIMSVQEEVKNNTKETDKIALIGYEKDSTGYFLKLFPQWDNINVSGNINSSLLNINATDIRFSMFNDSVLSWQNRVNSLNLNTLITLTEQPFWNKLKEENKFIQQLKQQWANSPYTPTFNTVDSVVIQSGHILLVKRGAMPGEGLFALPGGYLNTKETLLDSAIRELKEETKLKVPEAVLKGSIVDVNTFDDPHRSARGRIITTAFNFKLQDQLELPKVKGGDDAKKAFWLPLSSLKEQDFFEDHFHIINYFIK